MPPLTSAIGDCDPPLPAAYFQTKKKDTGNFGKWFYKCQNRACDLFLWEDDAQVRVQAGIQQSNQVEPTQRRKADIEASGPMSPASRLRRQTAAVNQRNFHGNDSDELDDDVANAGPSTAQAQRHPPQYQPTTPKKPGRTVQVVTPGTLHGADRRLQTLGIEDDGEVNGYSHSGVSFEPGLPTPDTRNNSGKRPRQQEGFYQGEDPPSPSKRGRTQQNPDMLDDLQVKDLEIPTFPDSELTLEIMGKLRQHSVMVPTTLRKEIQRSLNIHSQKADGVFKGREMARNAVKAKDARIVELQATVRRLEAERVSDGCVIRNLRDELGIQRGGRRQQS
ncbi:MAG: hypothetical protein M1814_006586 [Vezdaea aestivalis]|nr:MAG: hypothetical protein M1814_006586 [Vezdaea aestivalis]